MTFDIPEEVAEQFVRDVPVAERSDVITQLILHRRPRRRLTAQEWDAACVAANEDSDLQKLERDWEICSADGLAEEPND